MDDKMFDLMSKIYGELTEFRKETKDRLDHLEEGQIALAKRQVKMEAILENDIKQDIKILYDGYVQSYEKLETLEGKMDELSLKVDRQSVEIHAVKGCK